MKNKYSYLFLVLASLIGFSAMADLHLDGISEYEYLHCKDPKTSEDAIIQHYLIDVKNENINAIYSASAVKSETAKNVSNWALLDDDKNMVQSDPKFDVYIVSEKNKLTFSLNVQDDGGYSLSGSLKSETGQSELSCIDIILEK